jgi:hypothetical protein
MSRFGTQCIRIRRGEFRRFDHPLFASVQQEDSQMQGEFRQNQNLIGTGGKVNVGKTDTLADINLSRPVLIMNIKNRDMIPTGT